MMLIIRNEARLKKFWQVNILDQGSALKLDFHVQKFQVDRTKILEEISSTGILTYQ